MPFASTVRSIFRGSEPTALALSAILERRDSLESQAVPLTSAAAFGIVFGGEPTASGEVITEANALQVSAVFTCVRLIAESVAGIPLKVYERTAQGKVESFDHSLSYLLTVQANPDMSAVTFIESLVAAVALTGNGYAEIVFDASKTPIALWPLNPLRTQPKRLDNGTLVYETPGPNQTVRTLSADDVIHVPLFSFDGLKGLSPIQLARQTLGLASAQLKSGARFFGNGSKPGGILAPKNPIDAKQGAQMRESWEQQAGGINQGRTIVLPQEWSYTAIGMSLEDAQFLQARGFSRNEVGALYRVDPHYLGDTTRQAAANHVQMALSLIQDTLSPYMTKIVQEVMRKLLPATGKVRSRFFVAFDHAERLKADYKTTLEAIAVGRQWSILTIDEGRAQLGLNPVGPDQGGDTLMVPVNMIDSRRFPEWLPTKQTTSPPEAKE